MNTYIQQGDMLIFPIEKLPKGLKEKKNKVVVNGLNRHIATGMGVKVYDGYISVKNTARVKHPEHKDVILTKGNYMVKQVQEYSHFDEESRNVVD